MALERFSQAFAGAPTHAGSPEVPGRSGIQALIKDLQEVAADLELKDRHIRVLTALASFAREFTSDNRPVVFASNAALSRRCCGMPVPTLQRALRELCSLGFITRNMSPNGKRYTHRDIDGTLIEAFGIDLSPLLARIEEIQSLLGYVEQRRIRIRLIRDRMSLLRAKFPEDAPEQSEIRAQLRRRHHCPLALEATYVALANAANEERQFTLGSSSQDDVLGNVHRNEADAVCLGEAGVLTPRAHQNEVHYQSSIKNKFESKESAEKCRSPRPAESIDPKVEVRPEEVADACPEAMQFAQSKPKNWHELQALAQMLSPMIGIQEPLAALAHQVLGPKGYTMTVCCLVQKFGEIRSPAAYLTRLISPKDCNYAPERFLRSLLSKIPASPSVP